MVVVLWRISRASYPVANHQWLKRPHSTNARRMKRGESGPLGTLAVNWSYTAHEFLAILLAWSSPRRIYCDAKFFLQQSTKRFKGPPSGTLSGNKFTIREVIFGVQYSV